MAVRRTKVDRTPTLKKVRGRLVDLPAPGWKFTIECPHHGPITLDFESFAANDRQELATHFRDAAWTMRHEVVGVTLQTYQKQWRRFIWFLDHQAETERNVTCLAEIDRDLLVKFLAWMAMTPTRDSGAPLALVAQSSTFTAIKSFLRNRHRWVPKLCHPHLDVPKNAFPNIARRAAPREPYSAEEHKRIVRALNADLRNIHEGRASLDHADVLLVYLVALAITTGRNAQPLLELRRDSVGSHPAPDRKTLTTYKRRGRKAQASSIRASTLETNVTAVPANIAEYCASLARWTEGLASEADAETAQ